MLIRTLAASEAEEAGSEEADLMWCDERDAVCTGAGLAGSGVVEAGAGVVAGGGVGAAWSGAGVLMLLSVAIAVCCGGGVTGAVLGSVLSATTGLVE